MAHVAPWERQAAESAKAHAAFLAYRDLEDERSYAKVAEKLGKSETLISRWGSKHKWQDRVAAFDSYVEQRRLERNVRDRLRMADRHADHAVLILQKCVEGLNAISGTSLKPVEIARLFDVATRAEIRARGAPDQGGSTASVSFVVHAPVPCPACKTVTGKECGQCQGLGYVTASSMVRKAWSKSISGSLMSKVGRSILGNSILGNSK